MKFLDNHREKKVLKYATWVTRELNYRYRDSNEVFSIKGTILYFNQSRQSVDLREAFDKKYPDFYLVRNFTTVLKDLDVMVHEQEQMSLYPIK